MTQPPAQLPPANGKLRLAIEVVWTYARVRKAMFRTDLPTSLRHIRGGAGRSTSTQPMPLETGLRLGRAVTRTLAVLPADSRCLVQSLVLTAMLARRGTAATVVIGVKSGESFGAHAWVEMDGQPLLPTFGDEFSRLVDL